MNMTIWPRLELKGQVYAPYGNKDGFGGGFFCWQWDIFYHILFFPRAMLNFR